MQFGSQKGGDGCHPVDGCLDGSPFDGAFFKYLAANVFFEGTSKTIFPPYEIKQVGTPEPAIVPQSADGSTIV